jgi:hypothetical protein
VKTAVGSLLSLIRDGVKDLQEAFREAVRNIADAVRWVYGWHQYRLLVDPSYPRALVTITRALVSVLVPRAAVAGAIIMLVVELLEAGAFDRPVGEDDIWDE